MNYEDAINYVHAIPKFVRPLGNEKLGGLLGLLGNPQDRVKFVHVAGTNGKGSVSAMTAEILTRAGYKTGLFTSPYIEVFNERIKINGNMIEDDVLAECVSEIADVTERNDMQVSEFAFITAVAFKYFADNECDIAILETGMGGRLDATNIIPCPICAVLTSISLDHTQYLGDTIEEIALEKCGIIKDGGVVVSAPNSRVADIIKAEANRNGARLVMCGKATYDGGTVEYNGVEYVPSLKGEYQAENVAVVTEVIGVLNDCGYNIGERIMREGIENTEWIARYEFITPDIVIDGGHNPDGIRALKKSLSAENRPVTLVMAMMRDKNYKECIEDIADIAEYVVATELDMPRALEANEIKAVCDSVGVGCEAVADVCAAVKRAVVVSGDGLVCVCGSLYLAGEVRKMLAGK